VSEAEPQRCGSVQGCRSAQRAVVLRPQQQWWLLHCAKSHRPFEFFANENCKLQNEAKMNAMFERGSARDPRRNRLFAVQRRFCVKNRRASHRLCHDFDNDNSSCQSHLSVLKDTAVASFSQRLSTMVRCSSERASFCLCAEKRVFCE